MKDDSHAPRDSSPEDREIRHGRDIDEASGAGSLSPSAAHQLDSHTLAFYLEVPRNQIVLLQAFFELYDGVGTVRTLEGDRGLLCVFTTPDLLTDCIGVLNAIRPLVDWRLARNEDVVKHQAALVTGE